MDSPDVRHRAEGISPSVMREGDMGDAGEGEGKRLPRKWGAGI